MEYLFKPKIQEYYHSNTLNTYKIKTRALLSNTYIKKLYNVSLQIFFIKNIIYKKYIVNYYKIVFIIKL